MTTFAIIALTVLGTIGVEILILVLAAIFDKGKSIEQMDIEKTEKILNAMVHSSEGLGFVDISKVPELKELTDNELEVKYVQDFKYVGDLFNLQELKEIVSKSQNHQLKHHLNSAIRDELYELAQHIVDVAKERGITLKAELN